MQLTTTIRLTINKTAQRKKFMIVERATVLCTPDRLKDESEMLKEWTLNRIDELSGINPGLVFTFKINVGGVL